MAALRLDGCPILIAAESRAGALLDALALRPDEDAAEAPLRASRTQGWHHALALAVGHRPLRH